MIGRRLPCLASRYRVVADRRLPRIRTPTEPVLPPAAVPNAFASSSRAIQTFPPADIASRRGGWYHGKGKAREGSQRPAFAQLRRTTSERRSFHATARRDAIPLLPGIAILVKSTSILTAVTAISRVLFSFVPLGTIAAFQFSRGLRWVKHKSVIPNPSPEAADFYKLWCEGEEGRNVTRKEAEQLFNGPRSAHDGLALPDGRISYSIPVPAHVKNHHDFGGAHGEMYDPDTKNAARQRRKLIHHYTHARYFMPALPAAAVPFYERLTEQQRDEVDALRRYRVSVRLVERWGNKVFWIIAGVIGLPVLLLGGVWVMGLERVPLTGRWRLILLTPEEEDAVSTSLTGSNWFRSVINLLTTPEAPAPPIIPLEDWRWAWAQGLLRRLEAGIIADVHGIQPPFAPPIDPPPPKHPLEPRARASARLHAVLPGGEAGTGQEHLELGPPYNIMLMDSPDRNAFSYGFGGKGAGGIVIFTGLLDEILSLHSAEQPVAPEQQKSFWSGLLGSAPASRQPVPQPTEQQTLHLASILAHEMGHLLLSHHLETLSQQQVLWPSLLGLSVDLLRGVIWPFTLFLGPAINDALAGLGRMSTEEISQRYGHIGFQFKHEFEADTAALRILAYAGFDPRQAVDYFAESITRLNEIQNSSDGAQWWSLFKLWTWATHPSPDARVEAMKKELEAWEHFRSEA